MKMKVFVLSNKLVGFKNDYKPSQFFLLSTLNIFGGVPQVSGVGDFLTCAKGSYN
jgi:hypothetical protein